MRALLVGVGAVGTVVHRALEEQKGNEITFLLRPGAQKPIRTKILDVRTGALRVRERPMSIESDKVRPIVDAIVLCVRADQLSSALDAIGPVTPETRFLITSPAELSVIHDRYPGHIAARFVPTFMAYMQDEVAHVWQPPLVKSMVQFDDEQSRSFAEEVAKALETGGVPARARPLAQSVDSAGNALNVVLAGYALAQYDADAFANDKRTLGLVGDAISEVLKLDGAPGFGMFAKAAAAPLLRGMLGASGAMPESWRAMWRTHGPKIDGQTRKTIEDILERAKLLNRDVPALAEINTRLQKTPAPVTLRREATS
jgi:ketopantoate reductase